MLRLEGNGSLLQDDRAGETLAELLEREAPDHAVVVPCGTGHCGACTVLVDDRPALACMTRVGSLDEGARVATPTTLARDCSEGRAIVEALRERGGWQCGMCTGGIVAIGVWLLRGAGVPAACRADLAAALRNNICRCTGYLPILEALQAVLERWGVDDAHA